MRQSTDGPCNSHTIVKSFIRLEMEGHGSDRKGIKLNESTLGKSHPKLSNVCRTINDLVKIIGRWKMINYPFMVKSKSEDTSGKR